MHHPNVHPNVAAEVDMNVAGGNLATTVIEEYQDRVWFAQIDIMLLCHCDEIVEFSV